MISIRPNEIFDLNKVGLWMAGLIAIVMLFYPINLLYLVLMESLLLSYGYYLYVSIKRNKNISILINNEDKWFAGFDNEMNPVNLKDYWFLKQYLFIWAKGSENSVSFVVSRSIIGEQKFSQLSALIK